MTISPVFLKLPALLLAGLLFTSCGTMNTIKDTASSGVSKMGTGMSKVGTGIGKMGSGIGDGFGKVAQITTSPFRPAVPVVEAREGDLKELKSGQERALAFERKKRGFWGLFAGPVDFKEPTLPDEGGMLDGGLLPPIE